MLSAEEYLSLMRVAWGPDWEDFSNAGVAEPARILYSGNSVAQGCGVDGD